MSRGSPITDEELKSLKEAFALYDTENKGSIDHKHFGTILKSLHIEHNDEKVKKIVEKSDKNHDGHIDFDEFVSAMTHFLTPEITEEPEQVEDKTRDIQVTKQKSRENYSRCLSRHEKDELKQLFGKFDKNGDGQISEDELKEVMKGLGEKLSDQEIKDMMNDADTNQDGFIDFNEFAALTPKDPEKQQQKK
ncbi:uncharacterized protein B0P05DRAFT_540549 [Gilbertella persicaria]|uniref:EF-hand domain-containing protein n=1 Tax=Rhizopus stolonifer TaxID=4846 RepID=A0A367J4J2_RHIST|nr:uncharacterized protein B0P05DRAFT_540549 [Gilbertella persicaria]KAI8080249.1 hypothetical protein B0P05DRAFT_540549 [Gilbertella persicaria]RCH84825.1 hypothetical protein CU098_009001 [Rhizopus stolonifer]